MNDFSFRPYEGKEPYIFVSYSHADKEIVSNIVKYLHDAGVRIWYDRGIQFWERFPGYIAEHIKRCELFITFISNNSSDPEKSYCPVEIHYAFTKKKPILSIYLEENINLDSGIEMEICNWQSEFFWEYKENKTEDFFERMLNQVNINKCRKTNMGQMERALEYYDDKEFYKAANLFNTLAEEGNTEAKRRLGWMYLNGEIAAKQIDDETRRRHLRKGVNLVQEAAKLGNDEAMNQLGVLCCNGDIVKRNLIKAEAYFLDAVKKENHWAMFNLGQMYCDGEIEGSDFDTGVRLLYSSVQKGGNDTAMYYLGRMHCEERFEDANPAEGIKLLKESADKGNSEAMTFLGVLFQDGKVVQQNLDVAINFYLDAVSRENHWAMYNLAWMCCNGQIYNQDHVMGVKLLHDAADHGNAWALHDLSVIYKNGKWVKKNSAHAEKLERMAIEKGYTPNAGTQRKTSFFKRLFGWS